MTLRLFVWLAPLLLGASLLSACSSIPAPKSPTSQPRAIEALSHWQVRGKLSVHSLDDSNTGYLTWQQDAQNYDIYIAGPLGARSSRLIGNNLEANLLLPGWKAPETARSAEALLKKHLGWSFPVADLRYWVTGQPIPQYKAQAQYDETGRLAALEQQGWSVQYARYREQHGYWLPSLIKISGHDYRFVFAIQEWTIHD
jgi:outer membrane lipoprotein LolB